MVGIDVTIAIDGPVPACHFESNVDVKETVVAEAKKHLQKFKQSKLMRAGTPDATDESITIPGNTLFKEMINANIVLMPFVIGPHGEWAPMVKNIFFPLLYVAQ